ncbi:MAG: hypothetical protein PHG66_06690 [Candidatus Colwellbacteria bacterium]|nr:hypothetical protein [Candidatus Colwellbacteria bacterium]
MKFKWWVQFLLSKWDKALTVILHLSSGSNPHNEGTTVWYLGDLCSARYGIIRDNKIVAMGGILETVHHYDRDGKFISRVPMRKDTQKGDIVTYDKFLIDAKIREEENPYGNGSGMGS